MRLGFGEILVVLVIALLVFGPTKLPQLGEALGKGIRNFKKAAEGDDEKPQSAERAQLGAGSAQSAHSAASSQNTKA